MNTAGTLLLDPFGGASADDATRRSLLRYGAVTTLPAAWAHRVLDAVLSDPLPTGPSVPSTLDRILTARTAAIGLLLQHGDAAGAAPSGLDVNLARSLAALELLQPELRSALALAHVCELELPAIAAVERTDERIAHALVRGAELVLYHGLTDQLDAVALGADGKADAGWLVGRLPGGQYQPGQPLERAEAVSELLVDLADAILSAAEAAPPVAAWELAAAQPYVAERSPRPWGLLAKAGAGVGAVAAAGALVAVLLTGGRSNPSEGGSTAITELAADATSRTADRANRSSGPTAGAKPSYEKDAPVGETSTSGRPADPTSPPAAATDATTGTSAETTEPSLAESVLAAVTAAVTETTGAPRRPTTTVGATAPSATNPPVAGGTTTTGAGPTPRPIDPPDLPPASVTTRPSTSTTRPTTSTSTTRPTTTSTTQAPTTTSTQPPTTVTQPPTTQPPTTQPPTTVTQPQTTVTEPPTTQPPTTQPPTTVTEPPTTVTEPPTTTPPTTTATAPAPTGTETSVAAQVAQAVSDLLAT